MTGLAQMDVEPMLSLSEKWSNFGFSQLYTDLDMLSREILFTLANDYALGAGLSIVIVSLLVKGIFMYFFIERT